MQRGRNIEGKDGTQKKKMRKTAGGLFYIYTLNCTLFMLCSVSIFDFTFCVEGHRSGQVQQPEASFAFLQATEVQDSKTQDENRIE